MEEKLTCPICNRSDINLMTKHIKLHKITKEDFLKQYPGFRMQTEASRKKYEHGKFRSSWENDFAGLLKSLNIEYTYEPFYIQFEYEDTKRRYTPDFYLPDYNLVIEIKPERLITDLVIAKGKAIVNENYLFFLYTNIHRDDPKIFMDYLNTL